MPVVKNKKIKREKMRSAKEKLEQYRQFRADLQDEVRHEYLTKLSHLQQALGIKGLDGEDPEGIAFPTMSEKTQKRILKISASLTSQEAIRQAIETLGDKELFTSRDIFLKSKKIRPIIKFGDVASALFNLRKEPTTLFRVEKMGKGGTHTVYQRTI